MVARVGHIDRAVGVTATPRGPGTGRRRCPHAPLAQEGAGRAEALDAVVARVGHVDRAIGPTAHALGVVELPVASCSNAPLTQEGAGRREALDAVVVRVGHVDRAVRPRPPRREG